MREAIPHGIASLLLNSPKNKIVPQKLFKL